MPQPSPRFITAAEAQTDDLGDVKGPESSVENNIALFADDTGRLLKAAGVVEGVATIDSTTNILIGDDAGNAVNSTVPISAIGGAFLSANTARVDPSGSDETGTVGDLSKPFLTVQGAIDAIEAGSFTGPVIDVGSNSFYEDLTTSLGQLSFVGSSITGNVFSTLECTATTQVSLFFYSCTTADISKAGIGGLTIELFGAQTGVLTSTGSSLTVSGDSFAQVGEMSAPGFPVTMNGFPFWGRYASIDSAGSAVQLSNSTLGELEAAASVELVDSRIITNSSEATPTYADVLLDPATMDFSTLPTSDPEIAGRAWMDEGVFSISTGPP